MDFGHFIIVKRPIHPAQITVWQSTNLILIKAEDTYVNQSSAEVVWLVPRNPCTPPRLVLLAKRKESRIFIFCHFVLLLVLYKEMIHSSYTVAVSRVWRLYLCKWVPRPHSGSNCGHPSPDYGTGSGLFHFHCSPHYPTWWDLCPVRSKSCCAPPPPLHIPSADTPRWHPPCPSRHHTLCPTSHCSAPPPCPHTWYVHSPVVLWRDEGKK